MLLGGTGRKEGGWRRKKKRRKGETGNQQPHEAKRDGEAPPVDEGLVTRQGGPGMCVENATSEKSEF